MFRSSFASRSTLALSLSLSALEREENEAKAGASQFVANSATSNSTPHGEVSYHENVDSKAYKLVFAQLTVAELKTARLVCRKWHREIFPLLEEQTCFTFRGEDNSSDLQKARELSTFLNVVPKDSFQWKMLKALYANPEDALPVPVLIQWSTIRVRRANYLELRQWVSRGHVPNVSCLQLYNVRLNWSKYLLIFREFEGLSKIHDICTNTATGIWEEFEKGCAFNERLISTLSYQNLIRSENFVSDLHFHSRHIKEIKIRRGRLEEVILFMKLFLAMECANLETLHLSAEDTLRGGCAKSKKKNVRLQEPKTVLFAHLGAVLSRNFETLKNLKLSFRHSTISNWFDQYTKEKYEDGDGVLYKPDFRDFIIFIKHHRWSDIIPLKALIVLQLEFENKKIPTIEEIEYFTTFISSMSSLTTLTMSHFLLTSFNSRSMPLLLERIEGLTSQNGTEVRFGVSLRNNDTDGLSQSSEDRDQLPNNLEQFYSKLKSIIVTCHSHDMDVRYALFPWMRKDSGLSPKTTPSPLENTASSSTTTLPKGLSLGVEDLWVIDERPNAGGGGRPAPGVNGVTFHHKPLFHTSELVSSYPNLSTLIIRDSGSGLKASGRDLCRWTILDDYGLQLILANLSKLKHFDVKGNLFFLTDSGITGLSPGEWQRKQKNENVSLSPETKSESGDEGESSGGEDTVSRGSDLRSSDVIRTKRISFSSLKALEHCSLEYLGPQFTETSLKHGFNGMDSLKYLRIAGLIQVDPTAIKRLKDSYSSSRCEIHVISLKQ